MNRKRVLHVLASNARRGAEIFAVDLARALESRGWQCSVVAIARSPSTATLDIPVLGERLTPKTVWKLRRLMRQHDVAIAHGSTALPACALAGVGTCPFIYRSIGDPAYWSARGIKQVRTNILLRRARSIVALWDGAAASFVERGLDPAKIVVIPNGVDVHAFPPVTSEERSAARRTLNISQDARMVLYLGAVSAEKRPDRAVALAKARSELTVCIVGDGPMLSEIRRAAGSVSNLRVDGPTDSPGTYLAASDALFLPSATEGLPAAAIEAQLRGVPVVASEVGGMRAIVDHTSTGFLLPSDDDEGLQSGVARAVRLGDGWRGPHRDDLTRDFGLKSVSSRWAQLLNRSTQEDAA